MPGNLLSVWLALFLFVYAVTYCVSLGYVATYYEYLQIIAFNAAHLGAAITNVAIFATVSLLFTLSRFSFGYFVGFYLYSVMLGYAWIVRFSVFHYDHLPATVSAFVSILAFLTPALFITSPLPPKLALSDRAFDRLLNGILIVAAIAIATGALLQFQDHGHGGYLQFPERNGISGAVEIRHRHDVWVRCCPSRLHASWREEADGGPPQAWSCC